MRGLVHRLVGKRAGARDNADRAAAEDVARHDADLALVRREHARAVRPDQPALRAAERPLHLHHVEDGNALGDADDQLDLGGDRLGDGVGGEGRRHIDDGGVGAGALLRLSDGVVDRQAEMLAAALPRRDAGDHLGAVGERLLGMEVPWLPVMPWQMTLVFLSTRMAIYAAARARHLDARYATELMPDRPISAVIESSVADNRGSCKVRSADHVAKTARMRCVRNSDSPMHRLQRRLQPRDPRRASQALHDFERIATMPRMLNRVDLSTDVP